MARKTEKGGKFRNLGVTLAVFGIFEKIADRWSRNLDTEFYT